MGSPLPDPELFFVGLAYPSDEVDVTKEGDAYRKIVKIDPKFKNPERYSCPLELQDGDRQSDVVMLHTWSINKALAQDPTLRVLTEVYNGTSAIAKVSHETDPKKVLDVEIASVTRASASRHYIVNRVARDRVEPITVITVIPTVSVTNHLVAPNMPFRIAAPFLYAQIVGTRFVGDSIIRRNPNNEIFHWRQYRRPDPYAMDAGLRLLNTALTKLVSLARAQGSLIRALGEPDPVLKGALGEQLTAVLLGANYEANPSGEDGQILTLNNKPHNTTDPLAAMYRFDAFDSWAAVYARILKSLTTTNADAMDAVTHLAADMYLSILTTYTGATALREQGERVRANGFTVKRASSSTAGVHHCSLVDTNTDAVSKLRLRLGKVIPPDMIREYSLVAVFNVDVVGNPVVIDQDSKFVPITRIEHVHLDPSRDFSRQLRILPQVVPESYSSSSRSSKVTWHATSLQQLIDTRKLVVTPSTLTFDVLWPLTVASAGQGDLAAFGVPFVDTGSARVPLAIRTEDLYEYARTKNGGNFAKHVQLVLLAFLEETTDPIGLGRGGAVAYESIRRSGDFANPAALPARNMAVGAHSDPFVSRPIVGVTLIDIGLTMMRISADDAVEAARAQYNLPDDVAIRVRHSLAAINSNKTTYEQRIKDVLRYRIQCVSYVQKVLLAGLPAGRVESIGNLFDALVDTQLERPAGDVKPGVLVWSATKLPPPFPNSIENLGLLADRSRESMNRRAATLTWLERVTNAYGSAPIDEFALATWRMDRDSMVADFLGEPSNYSICVAMVDEREAIESARAELSQFADSAYLFSALENVSTVLAAAGVSPSLDRSGVVIEVLDSQEQGANEPDEEHSYRRQVASELSAQLSWLDGIRARFIPNDRIGSELPFGVVKENADAILSNQEVFPVSAKERKRLENILRVTPPKDALIVRQASKRLSENLKGYLLSRLNHPDAIAAINTSRPAQRPRQGLPNIASSRIPRRRGAIEESLGSSPTSPSAPGSPVSTPVTSRVLPSLSALSTDVYDAAIAAQAEVIKAIQASSTRVTTALETEKAVIKFMHEITTPGNVIIDHLISQTDIFSVSQARSFGVMAAADYEISVASGDAARPAVNVSEPVYTAVRQFVSLSKSGTAVQVKDITAWAVRIVAEREAELSSLYSVQVSLDSNNIVIKRLADLIDAVLTARSDTLFDNLFRGDTTAKKNVTYDDFYTKARLPIRAFAGEIALVQQRFDAAASEAANLLARLTTMGANAPPALVDEGIKMVEGLTAPNRGLIQRTASVAQRFARVIKKIVDDTNLFVLNSNPGTPKKPSVLMREIRSGFITNRESDYANVSTLDGERKQLAGLSAGVEQDVSKFRAKVSDAVARSTGQPLSSQVAELINVVENHRRHFGRSTPAMTETYAKFTATLDPNLVKYFLIDTWTSPEALETIQASYMSGPPTFVSQADEIIVWTILRDPAQISKLRAAYASKLSLLAVRVVDDAVGQIPLGTADTVKENFVGACVTATSSFFDAMTDMPRDIISRSVKNRLYNSRSLIQEFPTPAAMETMLSDELYPILTQTFLQEGRRLVSEYLDKLRIATTLALNTTLLWGEEGRRPAADADASYIIPCQDAVERLIGWKTGALSALESQMSSNLIVGNLGSTAALSVVRAVAREQTINERVPMPLLVYHAIQRGHINVDKYIGATQELKTLSQSHYATVKSMFAVYCRVTLNAIETSAKPIFEEVERLLDIRASKPTDQNKKTITALINAWLSGDAGASLMPPIHNNPDEVAREIYSLFETSFSTKIEAHLGGNTLVKFNKRYGWLGALEKTGISEDIATKQLRAQALAFCREAVFSLRDVDILFHAILSLFGIPSSDTVTQASTETDAIMEVFKLRVADLTARSRRYAGKSPATELWTVLSAPDDFDFAIDSLVPLGTATAAAASLIMGTWRSNAGDTAYEAKSIMFHWRNQVGRLVGRIQAMGDAIKDTQVASADKAVDQVTKDKTVESVQRMVDSAVSQILTATLVDTEEDYKSGERAYELLSAFYATAQKLEATFSARFTSAASKVESHLKGATKAAPSAAPASSSVPARRIQR